MLVSQSAAFDIYWPPASPTSRRIVEIKPMTHVKKRFETGKLKI